jgi:thiamine biosynthesis lipoprotein
MLVACGCQKQEYFFMEGGAQGTSFHITYQAKKSYTHEIDSVLKAFDQSLSAWEPNSILSRINRNDSTVVVDEMVTRVYNKALEVNKASDGMFDITVGPLVKAWGFYNKTHAVHDSARIQQLLKFVGMEKIHLEKGKIRKDNDSIVLDVNAIAQGYSVDVVSDFLEKHAVKNYCVEIGGELKTSGKNSEGNKWRVGIDKPVDGSMVPGNQLQTIIELSNKAMATSGDYRKFIIENGVKYAHHLNPKTGYPAKNTLLSATVVTDDCITADAYGTACMVLGLEKCVGLLKEKGLDGYLIYSDENGNLQTYITENLKRMIKN